MVGEGVSGVSGILGVEVPKVHAILLRSCAPEVRQGQLARGGGQGGGELAALGQDEGCGAPWDHAGRVRSRIVGHSDEEFILSTLNTTCNDKRLQFDDTKIM